MSTLLLAGYILIWPAISAAVLILLLVALVRDLRAAGKDGNRMV